jgi:hypothetical protein
MAGMAPEGIKDTVYKTRGGSVFHNDRNCELLTIGQKTADTLGLQNHLINPTSYTSVAEYGACSWCCAYFYYLKGEQKFVEANVGGRWQKVHLLTSRPIGHGYQEHRVRTDEGLEFVVRKKDIRF